MKRLALLVVLVVLASKVSMAQTEINTHRFEFSNTLETLSIEDALGSDSELAQRKILLRAAYSYAQDPMVGNDNGRGIYGTPIRDMHTYILGFGTMVSKRLFIGANLQAHRVELNGSNNSKTKLGDSTIQAKWRFTKDGAAVNMALIPFVTFDTGKANYFISDNEVGYGLKVAFDKTFGKLKMFLNLGYRHNDGSYITVTNLDRRNIAQGAFGLFFKVNSWLGFNAEYNRDYSLDGGDFRNFQAVNAAARFTVKGAHIFVGSGIESARGFENQDFNIYAGVKFGIGSNDCCKKKAPAPAPVVKESEVLTKELSVKRDIQFKTGSSLIKSSSFRDLDTAAASIVKYQDQIGQITIEGHSDSSGKASSNKSLSQKRADSVKAYLVSRGVKADKITAIGYGEERLKVNPEVSAADKAANRRVEFVVSETIELKK